jgi:hypothetical protein
MNRKFLLCIFLFFPVISIASSIDSAISELDFELGARLNNELDILRKDAENVKVFVGKKRLKRSIPNAEILDLEAAFGNSTDSISTRMAAPKRPRKKKHRSR